MRITGTDFDKIEIVNLLLISLAAAVVPMIVYLRLAGLSIEAMHFWGTIINIDFYSFYKMITLLFLGIILFITFAIYIIRYNYRWTYYYIPLIIYGIMAVISTAFAEYQRIAIVGAPDRYENVFLILVYIFLTIAGINMVKNRDSARFVLGAIFISSLLLGIHGFMQFLGLDLFEVGLVKRLITPEGLEFYVDFHFSSFLGEGRIYSTMYNPNFVGSYGAMLVSLTLGFYFSIRERRKKAMMGALSVLLFAYLLGSQSRAGMVGLMAGLLLLVIILRRTLIRNWRSTVIIFLAFIIVFVGMDVYSVDDIMDEIIRPVVEPDLKEEELTVPAVKDIETEDNLLRIKTGASDINIVKGGGNFDVQDEEGNSLSMVIVDRDAGQKRPVEEEYQEHYFQFDRENSMLSWQYDNLNAEFKYNNGEYYLQGMNNEFFRVDKDIPRWGFEGYEGLGSSRGYIWSRSLPMLTDTLLLGKGPDTYGLYFPQEDVVGKLLHMNEPKMRVDKPHNKFIQIAFNTGVVSLVSMMVLWAGYFLQGISLYWKPDTEDWRVRTGVAVMAAVAAYLVTGIFNDSVVSVAPVFWVLLGIGISMNIRYRRG